MKKYLVVVIMGTLGLTGSAAFGWHTRIINRTDKTITVQEDIMWKLTKTESFYSVEPGKTYDIARSYKCLSGIKVWAGKTEEIRNTLGQYVDVAKETIKKEAGSLLGKLGGKLLDKYAGKIESGIKKEVAPKYTAMLAIPASWNRCQHWDFIVTMKNEQLMIEPSAHVFGGGREFHPEQYGNSGN